MRAVFLFSALVILITSAIFSMPNPVRRLEKPTKKVTPPVQPVKVLITFKQAMSSISSQSKSKLIPALVFLSSSESCQGILVNESGCAKLANFSQTADGGYSIGQSTALVCPKKASLAVKKDSNSYTALENPSGGMFESSLAVALPQCGACLRSDLVLTEDSKDGKTFRFTFLAKDKKLVQFSIVKSKASSAAQSQGDKLDTASESESEIEVQAAVKHLRTKLPELRSYSWQGAVAESSVMIGFQGGLPSSIDYALFEVSFGAASITYKQLIWLSLSGSPAQTLVQKYNTLIVLHTLPS